MKEVKGCTCFRVCTLFAFERLTWYIFEYFVSYDDHIPTNLFDRDIHLIFV